jgi:murein DD-endopeptidase MepM/ murein hydrolase activator NlpD
MNRLSGYEKQLLEKKKEEQEVYSLIIELENRKKDMSKKYINELEKRNIWQTKLDKSIAKAKVYRRKKSKKIAKKKTDFNFLLPIADFISAQRKKNGVSFKFSETVPVKSPGRGKVVYVGELASYGKVVIIDHGKDVRSVLFGDIVSKVAKNNTVKQGQLLGYTMGDPGTVKSVYYEVRKKNKVQNTLLWLSPNQRKSIKI